MPLHRRKLDNETKNAVLYMQNAAVNRGIKIVEPPLFAYAILTSCRDYLERFFGSDHIDEAALAISKLIPEDTGEKVRLEEIHYAESVARYVMGVEASSVNGVASVLLDMAAQNDKIAEIFIDCSITTSHLERAAKFEAGGHGVSRRRPSDSGLPLQATKSSPGHKTSESIAEFCIDLTEKAKKGEIGDVFCRDKEIARVLVSLLRKIKCNPMLIGEPGVGKTAIVEGLAAQVAGGNVPDRLKNCRVMSLDISSVVSGTTLRGQFEDRMRAIMQELSQDKNTILFIDEVHMIVGAGDSTGSMDAGNMLKAYLARGDIRCIGATTYADYNRHLKKDGALTRRFQRINVNEVDIEQTREILEKLRPSFESFHGVLISEKAIEKIIFLTRRHISDRYFPDKAIDCLDEACARGAVISQDVDVSLVEAAVADLAGVPLSVIRQRDVDRVEDLRKELHHRIIGNPAAVDKFCNVLSSACSSVASGDKPLCTVAFYGPKGIGKKSVVRIAAEVMYGNRAVIEINGSEYTEAHSVSKILGSPPGYVGYSEESYLFREVRRRPYSIVLIHGVGLMHQSVREQFIKILKHGKIKDSEGTEVDFRSSVIVFVEDVKPVHKVGWNRDELDNLSEALEAPGLAGIFSSVDLKVSFNSVSGDILRKVIELEVDDLASVLEENGRELDISPELIDKLFEGCPGTSPAEVRRQIRRELEMLLAQAGAETESVKLGLEDLEAAGTRKES